MNDKRIFIVSENRVLLQEIQKLADPLGLELITAASLKSGIDSVLSEKFGVAFVDNSLQTIKGIEDLMRVDATFLIKLIHQVKPEVQVVVILEREDKTAEERMRALGITYLITYPFDEKELLALMKQKFK